MHVDEFRQNGFEVLVELVGSPGEVVVDEFLDRFIAEAVEGNRLSCAGGGGPKRWHFVMQPEQRHGGTDADRARVAAWLQGEESVAMHKMGPLFDLWHGPDPEEAFPEGDC